MTATDAQVRIIMRERRKGRTQEQAAAKANIISRKTVKKYEQLGKLPSETKKARSYRTRTDVFETDWSEIKSRLEEAPGLEAKALFEWLCEQQPGKYQEGQLRTFQRRVSVWQALHGSQLLTLEQVRHPGEVLQTDGTWMNKLVITIDRQAFPHLLIHSVLPYSNWQWGRVVQSESLLAIRLGLQSALLRLGYVPKVHQTDNSTAATHKLGVKQRNKSLKERGYNEEYLALMKHFGMQPRTTHIGSPNENGDIESANGALKRAVRQHLLLRGSRDFESLAAYEAFLTVIFEKRNQLRSKRLAEEIAVMKPLSVRPWPEMREVRTRVSSAGTIRARHNTYSVPSGLKGKLVTVRLYEWQLEVWYANQCVETVPRLTGIHRHRINYRHIIDTLLKKPGGFRNYRYRDDLFPTLVFRQAWEALNKRFSPRRADLSYLRILKLAAGNLEIDVAAVLHELLEGSSAWDDQTVRERISPQQTAVPELKTGLVNLAEYDQLLGGVL
jgi:hypothetical protein